ncbi:MAG: ABC transporter permease [Timaviella obliquedivisa GSE-PSE-MK23-08B]|jgi:ABC-type nickel/cobalt efflux system permease component RcnA|nr:ABC transporter permease [Timaviella obliquedivisa GSE-PSE-MK23-08B]
MGTLSCLGAIVIWLLTATPSQAHWSDMSAAEVTVKDASVEMMLTFPTGLVPFADGDRNQQLSVDEINSHNADLRQFFDQQIHLTNTENTNGQLSVSPLAAGTLPTNVQVAPSTHSTVQLSYAWSKPIEGVTLNYGLFLPGIQTAHCLATILQAGQLKTFMFTPNNQTFSLTPGGAFSGEVVLAIAGAFLWGAMHSLTPGHGKTLVGAYLMGERATPKHALILAMTTTITHTLGVFALGLVALFAAKYILPEQLYPWFSLTSGVMVVAIGLSLFRNRMAPSNHSHVHADDHAHDHTHDHNYHHHDHHHHDHHHHDHSHHHPDHNPHIDKGVSISSLLALGISGGLLPCPAALVLLLGAIAVNKTALGLILVICFSLGLSAVLTGLGLLLVYAKSWFKRVPSSTRFIKISPRFVKALPALSAIGITLIGTGISTQAFMQVLGINGG